VTLGRSGLKVSKLGFGASYGAPTSSYLDAFERGANYFYWGSRRRNDMGDAIREIARRDRDHLVVVLQSYARWARLVGRSVEAALRRLGLDRADVLLLGWYNDPPRSPLVDAARELQRRGLIREIAISGHRRSMFPTILDDDTYSIWHVRYNAVHRGAEGDVFPCLAGRGPEERPGIVTYTTTRWGHLCDPRRVPPGEATPSGTDCYRFALSRPEVDLCIAGPAGSEQLDQALRALDLGPMDEDELAWMRRVGDHIYARDRTSGIRDGK
jgi:aryl-alcohol dehydrogenase-like predicted oxidoreductase